MGVVMPRPKRQPRQQAAGLYQAVREAIEEDAAQHAARASGWDDPRHRAYPLQRILDALRASETTHVPTWAVPEATRGETCIARARNTGDARDATCFYVAVVRPDDTVVLEPDDGSKMLEYLGV